MASLSPREREVLAQMAEGKSNPAIAAALFLTKRGVEHVNAIFSSSTFPEHAVSRRVFATLLYLADQSPEPASLGNGRRRARYH